MNQPTKVVYLGSLPFDQTEQQVLEVARSVGPVVDFKLFFDQETGKPKGYAYVEYQDMETAASAVRNLNNYTMGNRNIKCSYSGRLSIEDNMAESGDGIKLPPLPLGIDLIGTSDPTELTFKVVETLEYNKLLSVLKEARSMAKRSPLAMKKLLDENPQLAYALVHAGNLTHKMSPDDINAVLAKPVANGVQNAAAQEFASLPLQAQEQIRAVCALTQNQIEQLQPSEKNMIIQLKEKYSNVVNSI
ncbi:hypothetical protein LJB42_004323 [Komagataella kurtzmanii]|nr:hypothetical protein LJB42_004323 [Komagataella kurtzmanii]